MFYQEESRQIPIKGRYDVIVCGAGPAGLSAAVSSARAGAQTLLVEKLSSLGGIWTNGLLAVVIDAQGKGGITSEIKQRLSEVSDVIPRSNPWNYVYDVEAMTYVVEQMCQHPNLDILLSTSVVDVGKHDGTLSGIVVENSEGRGYYQGTAFVDATGNGDLAALAGCSYAIGQEGTGKVQPCGLQAFAIGVPEAFRNTFSYQDKKNLTSFLEKHKIETSNKAPCIIELPETGLFVFAINHEIGVRFDDAVQVTNANLHGRKEFFEVAQALKQLPGWEKFRIVRTSSVLNIREGRRIQGQYTLTREDILEGAQFTDAICTSYASVDIHALDQSATHGYGNSGLTVKPYHIPLRALVSSQFDNLGMAGRCISGDFYAHASYRVTGDAAATGEAIGYAAALAAQQGIPLCQVSGSLVCAEMKQRGYTIEW